MGFPKDLENYKDHELEAELTRRRLLRQQGLCSYCNKPASSHQLTNFSLTKGISK